MNAPAPPDSLLAAAWAAAYLDPARERVLGHELARSGHADAAAGWLHVALAEARIGDPALAREALARVQVLAGAADTPPAAARWLRMADEVHAILLRRDGDYEASARLQRELDARGDPGLDAVERFVVHNSRAITAKLVGQVDEALRQFYAAAAAAEASGLAGPRVTALANLGGYHNDLFNLEDARSLSEQALHLAREVGARQIELVASVNLIVVYHAAGQAEAARALTGHLVAHEASFAPGALARFTLPLALGHLAVGEHEAAQRFLDRGAIGAVGDGDGVAMWAWLQARCHLMRGDTAAARRVAEGTLRERERLGRTDPPYETMQLLDAAADACEQLGDCAAALDFVRRAHRLYEQLVGRSARARWIALRAGHALAEAERERDLARDSHRSAEHDRRRLAELNEALQAQVAQTERLHAQLREQALRDPLTGLHNRRYLFEIAPGLLEIARREGRELAVVVIDLDHFKLLNDTFGHSAGDTVLKRFAALMAQSLRRSDIVCRHGGEEFVVVMPEIDAASAEQVLQRLLEAYQALAIDVGRRRLPRCSFSAGLAMFPLQGHTLEQLLSRADRALYRAKSRGRARIEHTPLTDFGTLM